MWSPETNLKPRCVRCITMMPYNYDHAIASPKLCTCAATKPSRLRASVEGQTRPSPASLQYCSRKQPERISHHFKQQKQTKVLQPPRKPIEKTQKPTRCWGIQFGRLPCWVEYECCSYGSVSTAVRQMSLREPVYGSSQIPG